MDEQDAGSVVVVVGSGGSVDRVAVKLLHVTVSAAGLLPTTVTYGRHEAESVNVVDANVQQYRQRFKDRN